MKTMKKNKIIPFVLTTSRLLIRPHEAGDANLLNLAIIDSFEGLQKWMDWAKKPPSIAETSEYISYSQKCWKEEEPYELPLLIFDSSGEKLIGASGFNAINWSALTFDIGYWVNVNYSGKGLITEAVNVLTRYAFSQWSAKRVEIRCDSENFKSAAVATRLKFLLAARLKDPRVQSKDAEVSTRMLFVRYDADNL